MATAAHDYVQPIYRLEDTLGMAEAMHRDGFVLIPGVLSAEEVEAARDGIDRLRPIGFDYLESEKRSPPRLDHFKCVFNRDRLWLPYVDRPGIIELAERVMGGDCHMIGMSAWRNHPGYDNPRVHVDQLMMELPEAVFRDPSFHLPIWAATAHYYLSDISIDLCPTHVIRGSHRSGRGPQGNETSWNGNELEPVLCRAGDVLLFRSEVWHAGGSNRSDRIRYLLQVHYARRGFAQRFSPFPWRFDPDILEAATPRQLRLLGKHAPANYD
jgi:ectoine hydroxylase-related dioxygenase (phytanoyl-CoA dioxygenase family)